MGRGLRRRGSPVPPVPPSPYPPITPSPLSPVPLPPYPPPPHRPSSVPEEGLETALSSVDTLVLAKVKFRVNRVC